MVIINLIIVISFIITVSALLYSYNKDEMCDGKPQDTVDSETWFARCGDEAPHVKHTYHNVIRIL